MMGSSRRERPRTKKRPVDRSRRYAGLSTAARLLRVAHLTLALIIKSNLSACRTTRRTLAWSARCRSCSSMPMCCARAQTATAAPPTRRRRRGCWHSRALTPAGGIGCGACVPAYGVVQFAGQTAWVACGVVVLCSNRPRRENTQRFSVLIGPGANQGGAPCAGLALGDMFTCGTRCAHCACVWRQCARRWP